MTERNSEKEINKDGDELEGNPTKKAFISDMGDMEEEIAAEAIELVQHALSLVATQFYDDSIEILRQAIGLYAQINKLAEIDALNNKISEIYLLKEKTFQDREPKILRRVLETLPEEELLKMKTQALEAKKRSAMEYESKKDQAFNFMDLAKNELKQNNFEKAVSYYKQSEKIFAEINWPEGIRMIKESLNVIKIKKDRIESESKKKFGAYVISKAKNLPDLQQENRRKELLAIQEEKEREREISEKALGFLEEGTKLKDDKKFEEAFEKYITGRDLFKKIGWDHEVSRINNDLLVILKKEMKETEKLKKIQQKKVEEKKELEDLLKEADEKQKELEKIRKAEKRKQREKIIQKERDTANEIIKTLRYNEGILALRDIIKKIENTDLDKLSKEIYKQIEVLESASQVPIITNSDLEVDENIDKFTLAYQSLDNAQISLSTNAFMKAITELNEALYNLNETKIGKRFISDVEEKIETYKKEMDIKETPERANYAESYRTLGILHRSSPEYLRASTAEKHKFSYSQRVENHRRIEDELDVNVGNKERILNLLKENALTSKEIAKILNLSEKNTRTYLLRLKKEKKIKSINKKGRFLVYTSQRPSSPRNQYNEITALEDDLTYLLNLMELKMTPKDGVKFTSSDLINIKRIEERIANTPGISSKTIDAIRDLIDFEQTYKEEINEKIAELEEKVNFITSRKPESKKDKDMETTAKKNYIKPISKDYLVCDVCGAIFSYDYLYCSKCGNKLLKDQNINLREKFKPNASKPPKFIPTLTEKQKIPQIEPKKLEKEKEITIQDKKLLFSSVRESINCENCGYTLVKPYPKDQFCPNCKKFLYNLFSYTNNEYDESKKLEPREFIPVTMTASSKIQGVKKKERTETISLDDEKINLKGEKEYVRFCGITSVDRTPLFATNKRLLYLLELTNNLEFIATSILGGDLDKMFLKSEGGEIEKCQFFEKDGIIYILYGKFPDKKGKWFLDQMAKYFSEFVQDKDVNKLSKLDKFDIEKKFTGSLHFIIKEYKQLEDVFTDPEIPYVDDWIRLDYVGLSSMSIGVISLLLDNEEQLNIKLPVKYENPAEEIEMKESLLTAKIEAIAANTLGNTGSYPRWIAVKLGFQRYRFLTFKKYKNDYFLSCLSEGNLKKVENIEAHLEPILHHGIDTPFSGNLRPFNKMKATIRELVGQISGRKFI